MNKVDELAKIIETGLAEGGALYDIDFTALANARKALAELVSLADPETISIKTLDGNEPAILVAASWIKHAYQRYPALGPDHACNECVHGASGVIHGFRCYYHMALAVEPMSTTQRREGK